MAKSLLEQLPGIMAAGKKQAQQILEQLEGPGRVSLQTRELVTPSRATSGFDLYGTNERSGTVEDVPNRLIYGDDLLAIAADFLVRTEFDVYVVETKAQSALSDENVKRKQRSALAWCQQINELDSELRDDRDWHYVLLGETIVRDWHGKGERASELLATLESGPQQWLNPNRFSSQRASGAQGVGELEGQVQAQRVIDFSHAARFDASRLLFKPLGRH